MCNFTAYFLGGFPLRTPSKVRITLDLNKDLDESLESIAAKSHISKSDVLRKALTLILIADKAKGQGQWLGIIGREKNQVVRQIVGV